MGETACIRFYVQVRAIIVETGGQLLGPPGHETPKGQGGVPRWNGPGTVCPLEAPPLRVVWERDRGDSLPHRQKKRIAHLVSRRSVRWCNQQLQGGAKKIAGGAFCVGYWSCRLSIHLGTYRRSELPSWTCFGHIYPTRLATWSLKSEMGLF